MRHPFLWWAGATLQWQHNDRANAGVIEIVAEDARQLREGELAGAVTRSCR
jgi:hypothetical protein